jgi:hypothetical protein
LVTATLSSTTNLTLRDQNLSNNYSVDWWAAEFTSGSDLTAQRGTVTINSYPEDVTITNVGDTTKAFIVTSSSDAGTLLTSGQCFSKQLTSTTNLRFNLGGTGQSVAAAWQVISTTGEFAVQEITKIVSGTEMSSTGAITSIDTGKSFVVSGGYPDVCTIPALTIPVVSISNATTLLYTRYGTGAGSSAWNTISHVVSLTAGTVYGSVIEMTVGSIYNYVTSFTQSRTFPLFGCVVDECSASTEIGDDHAEFGVGATWLNGTTIILQKSFSADDSKTAFQLIEIPAAGTGTVAVASIIPILDDFYHRRYFNAVA